MSSPLTIEQLENLKIHDLADLLANVVMVLRRMPDVSCKELQPALEETPLMHSEPMKKTTTKSKKTVHSAEEQAPPSSTPHFSQEEIEKKTVPELKKIAKELYVLVPASAKKAELVSKILAKQERSHSEQFAIQNM